ncbi:hypothetical protein FRC17_008481 [Serendipita sp. 399]|nr:hypothetical protein FRC17_008481 [Serendipita sp. 399]
MLMGVPITPLWTLFPNVRELTIFGVGYLVGGLLASDSLLGLAKRDCSILKKLTRLEIVGIAEFHPPESATKKTMEEVARLLTLLPNLKSLSLRGMNYIQFCLPEWMQASSPSFQLQTLELQGCVLSLDAFLWIAQGSRDSLEDLSTSNTTIWQKPAQDRGSADPALTLPKKFATLVLAAAVSVAGA